MRFLLLLGVVYMDIKNTDVLEKLLFPTTNLIAKNSYSRDCPEISDEEWIKLGILRVLSNETSGRGFLEDLFFGKKAHVSTGHFFEMLKSNRRYKFTKELNEMLVKDDVALAECNDPLDGICKELDGFDIYSGDGHHHKAPVHEDKIDSTAYSTQHFYALNMRTQMVSHIDNAEYGDTRKKEHDMRMLKRQTIDSLRQGAPKGRKVLLVWDKAGIDYLQWYCWKMSGGIYFLSVEKDNSTAKVLKNIAFDKSDERNKGIMSNEMVDPSKAEALRRITYQCPETGKIFVFLTNLPHSIPPGVIAYLYKCRWNLEKIYNTFKHKFFENRAWAKSPTAKSIQANFICLTYNLSIILSRKAETESKAGDVQLNKQHYERKQKRIDDLVKKAKKNNRSVSSLLLRVTALTELPKKFYRWLRRNVVHETSWTEAFAALCLSYAEK